MQEILRPTCIFWLQFYQHQPSLQVINRSSLLVGTGISCVPTALQMSFLRQLLSDSEWLLLIHRLIITLINMSQQGHKINLFYSSSLLNGYLTLTTRSVLHVPLALISRSSMQRVLSDSDTLELFGALAGGTSISSIFQLLHTPSQITTSPLLQKSMMNTEES